MKKFILTGPARNDIDEIWSYIAKDNPSAATRLRKEFYQKFLHLSEFPFAGHMREDLTARDLRFFPVGTYLIVYDPNARPIIILRILSGFRDITDIL